MKITFQIEYRTAWGESLGVTIESANAGPVMLETKDGKTWKGSTEMDLPKGGLPLLYRYGVYREGQRIRIEQNCMAHVIENISPLRKTLVCKDQWSDPKRVAGVAMPVFSLKSEGSFGVGDFGDLKTLIDWAVLTHQTAVQILPINDTTITRTWQDSYPYNSISIYAFHPQYIDLRQLPALKDKTKAEEYEQKQVELNALPRIDYEKVNDTKRAYLYDLYLQEGKKCFASAGFKTFVENNSEWLRPYAAFSVLRDQYGSPDFSLWPKHKQYNAAVEKVIFKTGSEERKQAEFYLYMQYLLHVQLLAASNYARSKGVILKGDIPIGISRASVEAWVEPFYFNMNGSAGAPPDPFSANGQNWGFPTYNWNKMEEDGLRWWVKRFKKMQEYFSAYRIDHILGFFRIWEIPTHSVHGLLGQFSPSLPMTPGEIEGYGLGFQRDFMTYPFINDDLLEQRFGPLRKYCDPDYQAIGVNNSGVPFEGKDPVQYVKDTFINHLHNDVWGMKEAFDTQRKVEEFFRNKKQQRDLDMKEALYSLISNVLFVEDHKRPGTYHPRISAQLDYVYTRLQSWEKDAFNRLYNDYFYRRHNQFWYDQAMKKLPALIGATQMIVCGEDLGMVPDCVPWVMNQLQILSLEIQRMPKRPEDEFGHVQWYPERSVCTTGTHDTEPLREWWELDRSLSQRFWNNELHQPGTAPAEATPDTCEKIVRAHLQCPSLFCILPFQDWLAIDGVLRLPDAKGERINIPANPRHYWRYRMHLTLEQLMKEDAFNQKVAQLIDDSNR